MAEDNPWERILLRTNYITYPDYEFLEFRNPLLDRTTLEKFVKDINKTPFTYIPVEFSDKNEGLISFLVTSRAQALTLVDKVKPLADKLGLKIILSC